MIQEGVKNRMNLFADDAGFLLHLMRGRMWSKKGKQQSVVYMPSQHQKRLNVIGWVDPIHGLHGMMKCNTGNTKSFLAFLKIICGAHQHNALHYQQMYYPELNCQEILWRTMRYKETTNVYFETFKSLKRAVFKRP